MLKLSPHTHSLISTFLCCVSMSWAGQRSASTTMPSSLRLPQGWEKGDTFLERRRRFWLMLCSTAFSPVKQGAFIGPLWPQQAEDWVPLMLWNSYYAAQNEQGDNPRHLFSHLSTHIHITKRACVRGVFICIVWSSLYAGGERETFDKRNKCLLRCQL